jgi:hypothetical protein
MTEPNPDKESRTDEPSHSAAKSAAAPEPKSSLPNQGDFPQKQHVASQDSTLMPAALYNLMIAEQYIDETKFPAEHKLVCFHYGVALLATHRDDTVKRGLASQYFAAAAGWQASDDANEESKEAIDRVVCESHYNLGVIEELGGNCHDATIHYERAISIATKRADRTNNMVTSELGILDNVAIVAQLGRISCDMKLINGGHANEPKLGAGMLKPGAEPAEETPKVATPEQKDRIERTRSQIAELRIQIMNLRTRLKARPSPHAGASAANASPRSGGIFGFLRRATSPPESTPSPEERALTESQAVVLRRQEILQAIETKLGEFERGLNNISLQAHRAEQP